MGSRDFAVVIGINEYDEIDALQGARNDAQEFVRWLKNTSRIDDRDLLRPAEKADASAVVRTLADLWNKVSNVGGRRLYIFYAGHGFGTNLTNAGVYASDFRKDIDFACYDLIGTANRLRFSGRFREVVVFMDCCRVFDSSHTAVPIIPVVQPSATPKAAHFYCLACGLGDTTPERFFDGKMRGEFSIRLMEALDGKIHAAMDAEGNITAHSLKRFLSDLPKTHCDPHDEQILKDLVLAKGFTPVASSFEIELIEPEKGFGLYQSDPFRPLAWKSEKKDNKIFVHREYQNIGAIITVPEKAPFERSCAIFPEQSSVKI